MEHHLAIRGQASIEFLLIMLVGILYLSTIIVPNVENAESRVKDISALSKLTVSADKLVNSIQFVSLAGDGTRQTIQIAVPENSEFKCNGQNIEVKYTAATPGFFDGAVTQTNKCESPAAGEAIVCQKIINAGTSFNCVTPPTQPGLYRVTVEKVTAATRATFARISDTA